MLTNVPAFSRVGNVCHMEHESNELVLILVVGDVKVFVEHVSLEVANSLEVMLHVSGQDGSDHVLSNTGVLLHGEARQPV